MSGRTKLNVFATPQCLTFTFIASLVRISHRFELKLIRAHFERPPICAAKIDTWSWPMHSAGRRELGVWSFEFGFGSQEFRVDS